MSIWKKEEYNTNTLNKNIEVNTLIIGGGLTGLFEICQDICTNLLHKK